MTKENSVKILGSSVVLAGLLFISVPVLASTDCSNLKGCERKFCGIKRQLNIAQEKHSERKADGLKKALAKARGSCTDKGLKEELVEEINEAKEEIAEYELDLKEAMEYGKKDKVRKYQAKIKDERNMMQYLEHELSNLD